MNLRPAILFLGVFGLCGSFIPAIAADVNPPIDRRALVMRHNPVLHRFDPDNPFTVGNGDFAFTADATGLQTFADAFTNTIPLGTLSQWGWHSAPNPEGWSMEKFHYSRFSVFGKMVGYDDIPGDRQTPEITWLRENPHRLHLGRIGFVFTKSDGTAATTNDLTGIEQTLDLWTGVLDSEYQFDGQPVEVLTVCHPERDLLAVRIISPLVKTGRARIEIHFPYGTGATATADWTKPAAHKTVLTQPTLETAEFTRTLDQDSYRVSARWSAGGRLAEAAPHRFILTGATNSDELDFTCAFAPNPISGHVPDFTSTFAASVNHWKQFWSTGGAIDLSASKDPRWHELERRIVLSQYLTAIQCSGTYPPQETGLTYNSWEGKFHLEMHWWHEAQFALWNRLPLLEKSLGFYQSILTSAEATARRQGYEGARWPKMTDPSGNDSPSAIGPFLVWQQPSPIFFAELCYRAKPDRATLDQFKEVVMQTAQFMASYPAWDDQKMRFVLGPVIQSAQEIFPKTNTLNPTFELTYWRWGLQTAQLWRQRLGLPPDLRWDDVLKKLADPATEQGKYLFAETATGTYTDKKWVKDHPAVLASLGMLPGPGIDRETMRRTLDWIWDNWNWSDTWGWDYPMLATCAARLGEPDRAVDALLLDTPKNHYAINGHNYQRPGLSIYLPGNGGLLYAVALMAAGWDGAPDHAAPGFPANGQWTVRSENPQPAP